MKKRILALTVTLALIMSFTPFVLAEVTYGKVSDWAKPELDQANNNGLIPDSLSGADMTKPITREEFAELAVKLYENCVGATAEVPSQNPFTDTTNSEILKAYQLGITTGTTASTFAPGKLTNREQVASMLSRTIRIMIPEGNFSTAGAPNFTDQNIISSWALEHVLYMAKLGIIKGSDGKFMPRSSTTREQAIAMSLRTFDRLNGASGGDNSSPAVPDAVSKDLGNSAAYDWEYIVINDFQIAKSDYIVEEKNGLIAIFASSDKLKYAIKFPTIYLEDIGPYMEFTQSDNNISIYWSLYDEPIYRFDMTVGSTEALFEGELLEMGVAPFVMEGKTFIPVNIFIDAFGMELTEDDNRDLLFIQFNKDFPSSYLEGAWSDTHTDLFTAFKDVPSGKAGLSSFAQSHIYNSDGTFKMRMMSVGGFTDKYVEQKGKYKVMGYTIMYYDITETVYEGNPFALKYENMPLKNPSYQFIESYKPESNKIEIGGSWLHSGEAE